MWGGRGGRGACAGGACGGACGGGGGGGGVFPVFTLLGNPLHMDLRNAYLYSLSLHFTV